ncbi:MAG TPA: hypothetical protein VIK52_12690 [Opitutaceae bacterium]
MKPTTITLGAALFLVIGTSSAIILRQQAEINELKALQASAAAKRPIALIESAPASEWEAPATPEVAAIPEFQAGGAMVLPLNAEVTQQRPGPRARGANRFAEMLADPELALMMKGQQRAELDGRYSALFRRLGLSGPETEALKDLLAEKQLSRMEANAVARAEGLTGNDRQAIRELVNESDDEVEARIVNLLGTDRYAALQKFENTSQQRVRVGQLELRLSYSQSPLQSYQSDAMVDILASSTEPRPYGRTGTPEDATAYLRELEAYDTEIYTRARSVLSPAQLKALRQVQQEREDRVRLGALMSRRRGGG